MKKKKNLEIIKKSTEAYIKASTSHIKVPSYGCKAASYISNLYSKVKKAALKLTSPYKKIEEQDKLISLLKYQDEQHWNARINAKNREKKLNKRLQEKQIEIDRLTAKINKSL